MLKLRTVPGVLVTMVAQTDIWRYQVVLSILQRILISIEVFVFLFAADDVRVLNKFLR